ncbi:unnamed protein product [Rotaria sp. Silwood1]|nr:unnamed protein product [Rotaria sp. Silwood1]CAF1595065.1 unnamed protein product [Rotaria sp. Silwood1]CAF3807441.1 unnamed protein product [Rotaria sp. Silwood1]
MRKNLDDAVFKDMAAIVDEELRTSLHMAAEKGNLGIMKLLIEVNRSDGLDARDSMDRTPLHAAASWSAYDDDDNKRRTDCIKLLVDQNADINATDLRRETPLHIACKSGSVSSVKCLLKSKADLLATNIYGLNCLEVAIEEENKPVVKYLLEHDRVFELMRNAQIEKDSQEAMMITGELNFNDVMYSSDQEAYYKLGYIMFILFAIFMTVITMNLLIGLAVGEIQGLLKQAKYAQLDMTYELARDYEVLRMQLFKLKDRCRTIGFQVEPYETRDMLKIPNHTKFGKWFSNLLARELFADELMDEPTDDTTEQQFNILQELQCGMQKITSKDHDQDEKRKDYQIKKKS